jgi:hypothetical protein
MTATRVSAFSRHDAPEVCLFSLPSIKKAQSDLREKAQGMPGAQGTRSPVCKG